MSFGLGKKNAAGALILSGRYVLLQQRSEIEHEPLTWCVFGGMAEPGERPRACMVRETREESGLDVSEAPYWLVDEFRDGRDDFSFYTYAVFLPERLPTRLSVESRQSGWFPLGNTPETLWDHLPTPLHSGLLEFVAKPELARRLLELVQEMDALEAHAPQ